MMIELYANSLKEDKELMDSLKKEDLIPHDITFGRAPFFVVFKGHADIINTHKTSDWLYYPKELGKALFGLGIDNHITCHSGREMENGEYIN